MKRWVVLVGGGGCGRWQAAALCALADAGLLKGIAGIVGTSVGGINACLLGAGLLRGDITAVIKDAWAAITKDEDIYKPGLTAVIEHPALHPLDDAGLTHGFLFGQAACDTEPLAELAKKFLGGLTTDQVELAQGVKIRARALNYQAQEADTLKGELAAMALCTSAIEGIFPRRWGYGDGGAVDNAPIDEALSQGADQIIVVYCGPANPEKADRPDVSVFMSATPPAPSTGLKDALGFLAGVTAANEDLVDQAAARAEAQGVQVVYCFPSSPTGSALDFSERGLWQRGLTESAPAIAQAKALGW